VHPDRGKEGVSCSLDMEKHKLWSTEVFNYPSYLIFKIFAISHIPLS
jgi:hypothetical protein